MEYLNAFLCGGILCAIGQILIDKTKLTPAKILVSYVVAGVILGGLGFYTPIKEWGGAGATVPLTGFGYNLAKGVKEAIDKAIPLSQFTATGVFDDLVKMKYEIPNDDLSGFAKYEQEIDAALAQVNAANS